MRKNAISFLMDVCTHGVALYTERGSLNKLLLRRGILEIKQVAPERTDVIMHADRTGRYGSLGSRESRERRAPRDTRSSRRMRDDDLVFGAIPRFTLGIITLAAFFIVAMIFGVKELDMTILVYAVVLVICTVIGVLMSAAPGYILVILSAMLLVVGAVTALFPAVAIGVAMMDATTLIIRGE